MRCLPRQGLAEGLLAAIVTIDVRVVEGGDSQVDTTFEDHVIIPGFVAQHDHPVLAALTMSSEILSIEDWVLPSGTVPAVKDKQDFIDAVKTRGRTLEDEEVGHRTTSMCLLGHIAEKIGYGQELKAALGGIGVLVPRGPVQGALREWDLDACLPERTVDRYSDFAHGLQSVFEVIDPEQDAEIQRAVAETTEKNL